MNLVEVQGQDISKKEYEEAWDILSAEVSNLPMKD